MKFLELEQIPYVPIVFGFALFFVVASWRLRRRR
jgi:hypothetical protein